MSAERGTEAMLVRRREILAQGAEPLGWKIGFNLPAIRERLGIERPLAGFLTSDGILDDGAQWSIEERGRVIVESEIAVELGDDARSIVALRPALEVADPPDLDQDVETILAGNIFHRGVAFGPRVQTATPGAARILVNGEEHHAIGADRAAAPLTEMVEVVADRLAAADERLAPGQVIITGVLAPPHTPAPGDTVRLEVDGIGSVELHFG